MSRKHASLRVEGDELEITDLGSSLGTYVNRVKFQRTTTRVSLRTRHTLLLGDTLFLVEPDVGRLDARTNLRSVEPDVGDAVAGAAVHRAWTEAVLAARVSEPLLVAN